MKKIVAEVPLVLLLVGTSEFYSILVLDFVQVILKMLWLHFQAEN
jgi:hypothetical protein